MKLTLKRTILTDKFTLGELSVDGAFLCFTCEDAVRDVKIQNETAIPYGSYKVVVTHSPHFGRDLPELLNVPNYIGVRIHSGNSPADTDGCILVGLLRDPKLGIVGNSRKAFAQLFPLIQAADECTIDIVTGDSMPDIRPQNPPEGT
jgi:hypothetical protein